MSDYQLDLFCHRNPDCGCKCWFCPAFEANQRYNLGLDENDQQDY